MRFLFTIIACACLVACGDATPDANDAELEAAAAAGRDMGENAASLPENSMAQQNAVLAIRARETAIRDAGYPSCADTFAIEAAKKLGFESE